MSELQSMTGFARASRGHGVAAIVWEVKSVNGRGLEARFRLPQGFDRIEPQAKALVQERLTRGNLQASLSITQGGSLRRPMVDEEFLRDLAELAHRLTEDYGAAPARADGLLALRGVLDFPDPTADEREREALDAAVLETFGEALGELVQARRQEGRALAAILDPLIARIEALTLAAEADPSRAPEAIRSRLAEQVAGLLDAAPGLDEARLAMEAAFLATKADIREEIDRLKTHVAASRTLIDGGGVVGRRLDFLAQEFNREANTLCSKSNAGSLTSIGLELKAVVDQLREQVQNLE